MIISSLKKGLLGIVLMLLFACNYNSSRMMHTSKDYQFADFPATTVSEYVLSVGDVLSFRLYTNKGTSIVDLTAVKGEGRTVMQSGETFLIESDGLVKLPILDKTKLEGLTISAAEKMLEDKYANFYINSFVKLSVTNRRVIVFPGGSGKAKVVPLENENMTMLEAIGQVGGLSNMAKAYKVKLIRGNLKKPQVYLFDFSTIEGIQQADFVLQANDIIYVEARRDTFGELIRDIAPVISLIASTITLFLIINNLK